MLKHHNGVAEYAHIPERAFLFVPRCAQDPAERDDYRKGEGRKIRRLLFEGWAQKTYTPFEREQLEEFDQKLRKKGVELAPEWDTPWRLRYLLSVKCDFKDCLEAMGEYEQFMKVARNPSFNSSVAGFLRQGIFYICGRDSHYRPILVFDIKKIIALEMTQEQIEETQTYFFMYVIREWMIPGQVENWVTLIDSNKESFFSFVSMMNANAKFLGANFRSRLFALYNVNVSMSVWILWEVLKKVLDEDTIEKVNIYDETKPEALFAYAHPSQIEQRFQGQMPNIQEGDYWPPKERSTVYQLQEGEKIQHVTREQYTEWHNDGTLFDTKFHSQNIIKPVSKDLRVNHELEGVKNIERTFQTKLESCVEDCFQYEKDIQPFSRLYKPVDYSEKIEENIANATMQNKK